MILKIWLDMILINTNCRHINSLGMQLKAPGKIREFRAVALSFHAFFLPSSILSHHRQTTFTTSLCFNSDSINSKYKESLEEMESVSPTPAWIPISLWKIVRCSSGDLLLNDSTPCLEKHWRRAFYVTCGAFHSHSVVKEPLPEEWDAPLCCDGGHTAGKMVRE